MTTEAQIAEALHARFLAEGALPFDADVLLPAETLLDLYGEDIRGRAYITADPLRGEMMLRPDFTVPLVSRHMENRADPARYAYSGKVFRKQEDLSGRATEYHQVGFELFDGQDAARADAEVFCLFASVLAGLPLRAVTGDIGILLAAVRGLNTTEDRKAALLRHLWRPARFRALLERFGGRSPVPETRTALLASDNPMAGAGPEIGLRRRSEIEARIAALRSDAAAAPIPGAEIDRLEALAGLTGDVTSALRSLRDLAVEMPQIGPAVDLLNRRLDALAAGGVAVETLGFEVSFGRTSLEYYDGFVFGFLPDPATGLPPAATGGRYDALTRVLGQGREAPAVGGVIRPAVIAALQEGQS